MIWLPITLEKRLKGTTNVPSCHPEHSRGIYFVSRFARVAESALQARQGEIYVGSRFARNDISGDFGGFDTFSAKG